MRFKTVRLTAIRNGLKQTISTSSELELLQEANISIFINGEKWKWGIVGMDGCMKRGS